VDSWQLGHSLTGGHVDKVLSAAFSDMDRGGLPGVLTSGADGRLVLWEPI